MLKYIQLVTVRPYKPRKYISIPSSVQPPSSRGLGQPPFTGQTGIRIPLGVLFKLDTSLFME